jgi:ABC-type transporter Mla MlaB component
VVAEVASRATRRDGTHTVILSLEESSDIDSTAVECLLELDRRLRSAGQALILSRVKEPVRDLLRRWDPSHVGSPDRMFWSVADAVQSLRPAGEGATDHARSTTTSSSV